MAYVIRLGSIQKLARHMKLNMTSLLEKRQKENKHSMKQLKDTLYPNQTNERREDSRNALIWYKRSDKRNIKRRPSHVLISDLWKQNEAALHNAHCAGIQKRYNLRWTQSKIRYIQHGKSHTDSLQSRPWDDAFSSLPCHAARLLLSQCWCQAHNHIERWMWPFSHPSPTMNAK